MSRVMYGYVIYVDSMILQNKWGGKWSTTGQGDGILDPASSSDSSDSWTQEERLEREFNMAAALRSPEGERSQNRKDIDLQQYSGG